MERYLYDQSLSIYHILKKIHDDPNGINDIWFEDGFMHDDECMLRMNGQNKRPGEKGVSECRSCALLSRVVLEPIRLRDQRKADGVAHFDPNWRGNVCNKSFIIGQGGKSGKKAIIREYGSRGKVVTVREMNEKLQYVTCDPYSCAVLVQLVVQQLVPSIPEVLGVFSCGNNVYVIEETTVSLPNMVDSDFGSKDAISCFRQLVYILAKLYPHQYSHCNPTAAYLSFSKSLDGAPEKGDGDYRLSISHGKHSSIVYGNSWIIGERSTIVKDKISANQWGGSRIFTIEDGDIDRMIEVKAQERVNKCMSLDFYCFVVALCCHRTFMRVLDEMSIVSGLFIVPEDWYRLQERIVTFTSNKDPTSRYPTYRQTLILLKGFRLRCDILPNTRITLDISV